MTETLTTISINPHHYTGRTDLRDVCAMHATIARVTDNMTASPDNRILWAQPHPNTVVIRAPEPVTADRWPPGYATAVSHRPWHPPRTGAYRAVGIINPVSRSTQDDGRLVTTPIRDRANQEAWIAARLTPMIDQLKVRIVDERTRKGAHRSGHTVIHRLITVHLSGRVTDHATLGAIASQGFGRARAYGGGLTIWEPLT